MAMRKRMVIGALAALAVVSWLGVSPATAGLKIDFNLIAPPQLVVVPGTPVAYAPAVPANYFHYHGRYYLFADGGWFVAGGYNGPWLAIAPAYVPAALLTVPVNYYRAAPWQWQHWHRAHPPRWAPVRGHQWHDHDRGPHRGDVRRRDGHRDDRGRDRGHRPGDSRHDHRRDRH
jgi:hypothetical protein